MSQSSKDEKSSIVSEEENSEQNLPPSRRKFLKVSAIAGATVAAVAVGASVVPGFTSAAKEKLSNEISPQQLSSNSDPIMVVVKGEELNIMQGERGVVVKNSGLASRISSEIN